MKNIIFILLLLLGNISCKGGVDKGNAEMRAALSKKIIIWKQNIEISNASVRASSFSETYKAVKGYTEIMDLGVQAFPYLQEKMVIEEPDPELFWVAEGLLKIEFTDLASFLSMDYIHLVSIHKMNNAVERDIWVKIGSDSSIINKLKQKYSLYLQKKDYSSIKNCPLLKFIYKLLILSVFCIKVC